MLEKNIEGWTFRFVLLKSDVIIMQNSHTNLWAMNLTIAVIAAPDEILPDDLFRIVNDRLFEDGFFRWGIIRNGNPVSVSGVKIAQPNGSDDIPEDTILTISLDYRLLTDDMSLHKV